jgi:hypothetical protein
LLFPKWLRRRYEFMLAEPALQGICRLRLALDPEARCLVRALGRSHSDGGAEARTASSGLDAAAVVRCR